MAVMATRFLVDCTCEAGDDQRIAWAVVNLVGDRFGNGPAYRAAWAEWWAAVEARKVECTCTEPEWGLT